MLMLTHKQPQITYLANIEWFISCVLLQYEELVPYPAAFVPEQGLPGVWIRVRGLLQIPRAGIQPRAAPFPQGKQERQESQGSAYVWATPPHHLGPLQKALKPEEEQKFTKKKQQQKRTEKLKCQNPQGFIHTVLTLCFTRKQEQSDPEKCTWVEKESSSAFCCVALLFPSLETKSGVLPSTSEPGS